MREPLYYVVDSTEQSPSAPLAVSVWAANRQKNKISENYIAFSEKKNYMEYTMGNEFLIIPDTLKDVTTTIVSLLSQHIDSFSQVLNKG